VSDLQHGMTAAARMSREDLQRALGHAVEAGVARECADQRARREEAARARGCPSPIANPAESADVLDGYDGPHRAIALLTLAATRLPLLAAELARLDRLYTAEDGMIELALLAARDITSSTLGLAQLALAAHAQSIGYDTSAWIGHALNRARATLLATDPTAHLDALDLMQPLRQALHAFTSAADAITNHDGMRVADELATSLGQTLVLFAIMSEALDA
jgi:hypothetical protein